MKTVVFHFAKSRRYPNYSISNLFTAVQNALPSSFEGKSNVARYESKGFWKRVCISLQACFRQGDINHVTGDIHFIAILLKRKKTVLTVHDCGFMNLSSPIARFLLRRFWLTLPVRCANVVTVVSEHTKEEVLKYVRCNPAKIRVVPNFISLDFTPFPKSFNTNRPTILHIGSAPNKNLERLVMALEGVSCHLLIVGKLSKAQTDLLNRVGVSYSNVYNLTSTEVVQCYRQCDLLAFVSTAEGFGLPILEAQATGRPVITSNLASMPQVAGEAACLVNPYDVEEIRKGIITVIKSYQYREELIAKGYENIKRYSFKSAVAAYATIYEEMLSVG